MLDRAPRHRWGRAFRAAEGGRASVAAVGPLADGEAPTLTREAALPPWATAYDLHFSYRSPPPELELVRTVSHTVRRKANVNVERLFDTVVAEDVLPKVLHRWGPVPAVVGTRDLSGPWDTPGSTRTVMLGDGSTAREQVLVWERPGRFEYRVDSLTNPLGRLVDHATGVWEFAVAAAGSSSFQWTYTFHAERIPAAVALRAFVPTAWGRYMSQCADLSVALAVDPR